MTCILCLWPSFTRISAQGHTEDGFAPVPRELYHTEWERRKLRNTLHLTLTACLGQCSLANVALLIVDGQSIWFHTITTEGQVLALYDYIEALLEAKGPLSPPFALQDNVFDGFVRSESDLASLSVLP